MFNLLNNQSIMKKNESLIVSLCLFLFLFISCTTDYDTLSHEDSIENVELKKTAYKGGKIELEDATEPKRVDNQLVVRFRKPYSYENSDQYNNMKANKRDFYSVTTYQPCSCDDDRVELWTLAPSIDVETKLGVMDTEEDLEGDFQFLLEKKDVTAWYDTSTPASFNNAHPAISATNAGANVVVAVIDSGVNYNYSKFQDGFLYKGGLGGSCFSTTEDNYEYSGWNFADNNNNPFDYYGHGTVVTELITSQLDAANVDYRVLPVKVFDKEGKTNYFKIACGFNYAAENTDVNIMVSSLGWYLPEAERKQRIVKAIIEEAEDTKIIIASAGNANIDSNETDIIHYPSGYEFNNILSVAGTNTTLSGTLLPNEIKLAWFSNSGTSYVDIAAPSENIPFYFNGQTFYVSGTSFANGYTAGKAALLFNNQSITSLKNSVINSATPYQSLAYKVQYKKAFE